MIHVCFGLHDKTGHYSKFTGTAMLSLFENTSSDVTVHILHDNTLTPDNRDKFVQVAKRYRQRVRFYNVEQLCSKNFLKMKTDNPQLATNVHFTIGTMFRLFIPQILSADIDKVIYLDSDIIVTMDLNEFWTMALEDNFLAVVTTNSISMKKHTHKSRYLCVAGLVEADDYFNGGVLFMNLRLLRNETDTIMRGINFIGREPRYMHFDQDVLNYCFAKRTLKLPPRFNHPISFSRAKKETVIENKIYHYFGSDPRWFSLDTSDPFNRLWLSYFIRTPWFNADTIRHIHAGFLKRYNQLHNASQISLLHLSALMSGKTRAFFFLPKDSNAFKKIFSIRDDEEIISAEGKAAIPNLVYAMGKAQGKKVFFLLVPNFYALSDLLQQIDFIPGKDFINGLEFLSEAQGIPLNSYELIKAM